MILKGKIVHVIYEVEILRYQDEKWRSTGITVKAVLPGDPNDPNVGKLCSMYSPTDHSGEAKELEIITLEC